MYKIPTCNCSSKEWVYSEFDKESMINFVKSLFKHPGEYNFDENYLEVINEANKFKKNGYYCNYPSSSSDYRKYWDFEKEKCRNGVIIKSEKNTWFVTRDYYMWLNFLPIYHKEKKINQFPDLYDGQYHTALYETLGELLGYHAVMLKKRQYAMSYYHMAKLINQLWFEEGVTLKLISFLDAYIGLEGSWGFINEYRDFLNEHTAWYRPFNPSEVGRWQQRVQVNINGKDVYKGLKGRLLSVTTQQSPTKGVGGASRYVISEESGLNPTLDKTYVYAKSGLELGPSLITGQFIAYGSVGDLKQCEPLKKFMLNPRQNGFFGVETQDYDDVGTIKECGLFIPVHWNMPGFSDRFGNSDLVGAKNKILEIRAQQKKDLTPADYQLNISQNPLTIKEAFAYRDVSRFPLHLVSQQIRRIEEKNYYSEYVDLIRNLDGTIKIEPSNKLPIFEFPINPKEIDKSGIVVMYERPDPTLPFTTYLASIDPVSVGKTTTSESLCSIIVYKMPIEKIIRKVNGQVDNEIEQGKIVCTWCGRFDDIRKVHERLEMILEVYNAWAVIENNVPHFITYMIEKRKQKYLVPKNQILFLKELSANTNVYQEYGWKNVGRIFYDNLIPYGVEFLNETIGIETKPDGDIVKTTYGIERIPDIMILREMEAYNDDINVDRLISFCALAAFVSIQIANRGYAKQRINEDSNLQNQNKNINFIMGQRNYVSQGNMKIVRKPFKNIR